MCCGAGRPERDVELFRRCDAVRFDMVWCAGIVEGIGSITTNNKKCARSTVGWIGFLAFLWLRMCAYTQISFVR